MARSILVIVLPHHALAQPVALPLRAAVLECRVYHEGRAMHHMGHPCHLDGQQQ